MVVVALLVLAAVGGASALPLCTDAPVIVVGAGFAGLAAANELQDRGCEVIVLEATDAVGGRAQYDEEQQVDLGAGFFHGLDGGRDELKTNPMFLLAERFGLEDTIVEAGGDSSYVGLEESVWFEDGRPLSFGEIVDTFRAYNALYWGYKVTTRSRTEREQPLRDVPLTVLRQKGTAAEVFDAMPQNARNYALYHQAILQADWAITPDLSSGHNYDICAKIYPTPDHIFAEGSFETLATMYAAGLDVRFGERVVSIAYDDDGVVMTTASGSTFVGSAAIVTVSLGVLQHEVIDFSPPLPQRKVASMTRLEMGVLERVVFEFDQDDVFWPAEQFGYFVIPGEDEEILFTDWYNVHAIAPKTPRNRLSTWIADSESRAAINQSDEQLLDAFFGAVKAAFGDRARRPTAVIRSKWVLDENTFGSYSALRVGSSRADLDVLAEPVGATLRFAGEATSSLGFGYLYGAFASGLREARDHLAAQVQAGADVTEMTDEYFEFWSQGVNGPTPNYCPDEDSPKRMARGAYKNMALKVQKTLKEE